MGDSWRVYDNFNGGHTPFNVPLTGHGLKSMNWRLELLLLDAHFPKSEFLIKKKKKNCIVKLEGVVKIFWDERKNKYYIRPLCAYSRRKFSIDFRFPPFDSILQYFSTLSLERERKKEFNSFRKTRRKTTCVSGTTLEAGSFGAVSKLSRNRSKSGDGRKGRDDSPLLPFQIDSPRKRPLSRNGRLGGKRTKGMHNVTWDEIRGGMCVNVKRHVDIGNVSLCGFTAPSCGDLAFSRALSVVSFSF